MISSKQNKNLRHEQKYLEEVFSLSCALNSGGVYTTKASGSLGSCKAWRIPALFNPNALPNVGPV